MLGTYLEDFSMSQNGLSFLLVLSHTTSGNGANDQCNEDNAVESAIEALRTEYEGNALKDSKSKELFDTLLGDTNESENYKSMFKRCISKKLGQVEKT